MSVDIDERAVELEGSAQMSDISCANLTPDNTNCTFYITEDGDYSVMFTESNEIGSSITTSTLNCEYTLLVVCVHIQLR